MLFGALASGGQYDGRAEGPSDLSAAIDGALSRIVTDAPHLALDAADLDIVPSGREITAFSVLTGTSEPLAEEHAAVLQRAISAFGDSGYHTGFVVLDLTTGRGVSYNADENFFSASTVKAPFATFLWQELIETGEADLGSTLVKDDVRGGTGIMALEEDKDEYTLEEVVANTIMYSDNTGYAMLRNHYDGDSWDAWTAGAGVPEAESEAGWYYNYCARDLAKYWIAIDAYLETNTEGAQSIEKLFGSTEISFIRQALGSECEVRAKAGFESSFVGSAAALNDAGIVESPTGDYLVAVMSDADYSHPEATENATLIIDLIKALGTVHDEALVV
ncbi:serine hydrolase [Raoultibacter phocaeensis]|uniref:serine hydrolase n=1 Tax=Raoultibacter phocaeensis TaxID=2479841 RepID=UPI0015D604A3|nr:serine hydrolase [Raoultibacter phocaeensis]